MWYNSRSGIFRVAEVSTVAIIDANVRTITPEDATRLLSTNHQNRVLNKDRVNKYASDMRGGAWKESGQGITIYREPNPPHNEYLQDGQTRLYGIIESGTPQRFVVVYVDEPVFDVIDTGQSRSLTQMINIHFRGAGNSGWLAVIATALSIRDTLIPYGHIAYRTDSKASRIQRLVQNPEAAEFAMPLIKEGYLHCGRVTGPAGHIAAMLSLTQAMDDSVVLPFFRQVASGENLRSDQPQYALRESLLSRQFGNRHKDGQATTWHEVHADWYEAAIRAWNSYLKDEPMTNLRITGTIPPIALLNGGVINIERKIQERAENKERSEGKGAATRLAERRARQK
jgi:hypothetical protein